MNNVMYNYAGENEKLFTDVPSWIRRGHTRKPNRVVLALYDVFDTIGDFGPMFASFFRFIWRSITGTWNIIIRAVMIMVNIALLVGIIYVSVGHSYRFLTVYGGMSGISAMVFVAVWETVFVYCSLVIDYKYRQGKKSHWADWAGFIMGWLFVEVSNFMGMADNWYGKSIGLATPILLLIMKKVLQNQFNKAEPRKESWLFRRNSDQMVGKVVENRDQNGVGTDEKAVEKVVENDIIFGSQNGNETVEIVVENGIESDTTSEAKDGNENEGETVEKTVEKQQENKPESHHQTVNQEVENRSQSEAVKPEISMDSANENLPVANEEEAISGDGSSKEAVEGTVENETENDTGNDEKAVEEMVENDTGIDTGNDEKVVEEMVENDTENDTGNDEKAVEETVENETEKKTTKRRKLVRGSAELKSQLRRSVKRFAKQYFKENGKPPGRVIIQKQFGVNQSLARDLADYVKNELRVS